MTPADTEARSEHIVLPPNTNAHGTCFGGQISAWVDIIAAISAQRASRGPVVTASMDSLHFRRPIPLGHIVTLKAIVNRVWSTSMEVGVKVTAEDPHTGEKTHTCTAYLTFVALDDQGKPRSIDQVTPTTPEETRRWSQAEIRRQGRLKTREALGE